jgi:hypothetical protein
MSQQQKKQPNVVAAGMGVPTTPLVQPQPNPNPGMAMVAPSPNIVQRIMGGVMSNRMMDKYPEVAGAYNTRSLEAPQDAANTRRIGEMGWLKRKLTGDAYGSTSPFGTIELNMDAIRRDKQDVGDVLAHEMAHAGQGMMGHIRQMFGSREPEDKAISAEVLRKVRKTDIPLR